MKRAAWFAFGAVLFLLGLWGGSYAMGVFGWDDWRKFPAFVTGVMVCALGCGCVIAGSDQ